MCIHRRTRTWAHSSAWKHRTLRDGSSLLSALSLLLLLVPPWNSRQRESELEGERLKRTCRASVTAFQMLCKTRAQQSPDKLWHGIIIMGNNNGYLEHLTHTASQTPLPASPDKLWYGIIPTSRDKLRHGIIPASPNKLWYGIIPASTKNKLSQQAKVLLQKICLSWQNIFVATKLSQTEPNICHDKCNFVATKVLSQQAYFCHDKHVSVTSKHIFCCNKSMPVTTNVRHNKTFVVTNIILTKKLSWQASFCHNKRCVLSWQIWVWRDKNFIYGSFHQWQQDPTTAALPQRHPATSSQVSWYNDRVFVCVHALRIISMDKTLQFIKKKYIILKNKTFT